MVEKLRQFVDAIKDEAAVLESNLTLEQDPIKSAEIRGRLEAVRAHGIQLGGIIEAEHDEWHALYKEIS